MTLCHHETFEPSRSATSGDTAAAPSRLSRVSFVQPQRGDGCRRAARRDAYALAVWQDGLHDMRIDRRGRATGLVAAHEQAAHLKGGVLQVSRLVRRPQATSDGCNIPRLPLKAGCIPEQLILATSD